jgi:sodium transport system permease protein
MLKVYFKELLELTRDKKTLMFTILLPTLLMPIILIGFSALVIIIDDKARNETLDYTIVGAEFYPEFAQSLEKNEKFNKASLAEGKDIKQAISDDEIRFQITIPSNTRQRMEAGLSAEIEILYNDSSSMSSKIINRINETIKSLKGDVANIRLSKFGLSVEQKEGLIDPIKLVEVSTADDRESIGERIGGMFPYILILIGLAGAMYPAIDLGVGEKERGTLETLLLTPIPRIQIVFAKFLVIFTTSFMAILLSLISFGLMILVFGPALLSNISSGGGEGITKLVSVFSAISVLDILLIFLMLVPVSAIFGATLLSVSIYARTFKEAQNYMSPLTMVAVLPVVLALLPGVKLDWVWASVPLTNVALAIKEIFKGTIDYSMLAVILLSTTIVAGMLLSLCNWWFQREEVLFRN